MGSATPSLPLRHIQEYRVGGRRGLGIKVKNVILSWVIMRNFFSRQIDVVTLTLSPARIPAEVTPFTLYCKPPFSGNDSGWQVDFENCQSLIRSLISLPCESQDRCVILYPSFDWIGLPWKMLSFTLYKWLLLHDLTMKIENISNVIFTDESERFGISTPPEENGISTPP